MKPLVRTTVVSLIRVAYKFERLSYTQDLQGVGVTIYDILKLKPFENVV